MRSVEEWHRAQQAHVCRHLSDWRIGGGASVVVPAPESPHAPGCAVRQHHVVRHVGHPVLLDTSCAADAFFRIVANTRAALQVDTVQQLPFDLPNTRRFNPRTEKMQLETVLSRGSDVP